MIRPLRRPARARSAALLLAGVLALSAAPASAARVPAFTVPVPVTRTLENGLTVLVIPQHHVPLVQVQVFVPFGSTADPVGKEGLAALTAQMLRRGTTSRDAASYSADVERLGGAVASAATREFSTLSGSFLARDLAPGLEVLADAAIDPRFEPDEIQRTLGQMWRAQAQTRANPAAIADEQVWTLALRGNPLGRPALGDPRSLGALDREAVRAFHRDYWRPDQAVLAIAGDVDPEAAFSAARESFGRWSGKAAPGPRLGRAAVPGAPRVGLVDLPGERAELRVALVAPGRAARDREAMALAAAALVGGPDTRLAKAARGWSGVGTPRGGLVQLRDGGLLVLALTVPADSAARVLTRVREVLRAFAERPPGEDELAPLRRARVQSFPLAFETLGGLLGEWQTARFDGLSADSLVATPRRYAALTAADVAQAAERWVSPARSVTVVVGPAARTRAALEKLGDVEVLRLDALAPAAAAADTLTAATPARVAEGRAWIARCLAAHGGLERLRRVKDSRIEGDLGITIGGREVRGSFVQVRKDPYRMYHVTRLITMESVQILDGTRGWSQSDPDSPAQDLDSTTVTGLRAAFIADLPHLLLAAADSAATVVARGPEKVGETPTQAVEVVTAAGERRRYHLDPTSARLVAVDQFETPERVSALLARRIYGDLRMVDGVLWPFSEDRRTPGDNSMRLDVKSVRLDTGVSDGLFYRPVPGVKRTP